METPPDPKELMRRAKAGDETAIAAIYELYFTPVYRYLRLRVANREDCEDLVQMVFLKAYQAFPNFQEREGSPLAYFFTIARNLAIDHWRKQRGHLHSDIESFELIDGSEASDQALAGEGKRLVYQALAKLKKDQREVLILRFINELSNREIAGIMEKTEEAVRQIQSRALRALRKEMKPEL